MLSGLGSVGFGGQDIATAANNFLKKADTDADGKISKDELGAILSQNGQPANVDQLFAKIDTNGDGYIDAAENLAQVNAMSQTSPVAGASPSLNSLSSDPSGVTDVVAKLLLSQTGAGSPVDSTNSSTSGVDVGKLVGLFLQTMTSALANGAAAQQSGGLLSILA